MSGSIAAMPEQLQSIDSQVTSGDGEVESVLSQLSGMVSPLQGDWVGSAQAQFEALWEQWQRDAAGLHDALTGIANLLRQAGSAYETNEQQVGAMFRS